MHAYDPGRRVFRDHLYLDGRPYEDAAYVPVAPSWCMMSSTSFRSTTKTQRKLSDRRHLGLLAWMARPLLKNRIQLLLKYDLTAKHCHFHLDRSNTINGTR